MHSDEAAAAEQKVECVRLNRAAAGSAARAAAG